MGSSALACEDNINWQKSRERPLGTKIGVQGTQYTPTAYIVLLNYVLKHIA